MQHQIIELPYERGALMPYISPETIEYHYDKHHQTYLTNLNKLVSELPDESPMKHMNLEALILHSHGDNTPIFNNAGQVWNHNFYWMSLTPVQQEVTGALRAAILKKFSTIELFYEEFVKKGMSQFGSGWVWLIRDENEDVSIMTTSNADNPMLIGKKPLLVCDVWEHAYYIDYRNKRAEYLQKFIERFCHWSFAQSNFAM